MAADAGGVTRHAEIERKFAVTDAAVSPSFDGLAAVASVRDMPAVELDAVYFDTPGHDLARNRITLRRRTGGTDAGWHLKLPATGDARTEVHAPLDSAQPSSNGAAPVEVPAALRDVVLALVRDRPLTPVARIATARSVRTLYDHDGAGLAEFCDDRVSASADGRADGDGDGEPMGWREWELEVTGEAGVALLDRLSNRLLDAGAEPAEHGSKLARVLGPAPEQAAPHGDPLRRAVAGHVAELLVWDRAVREDAWDSVHQMRVTIRKIRSLVKGSEAVFGLSPDAWVLGELRELAAILGVARDAEVLGARHADALAALPADLVRGPIAERLVQGARRRYEAGLRRSLVAMRSTRYFRLLDALEGLAASAPGSASGSASGPGEAPPRDGVARALRKVRKARAAVDDAEPAHRDEALHRIRKAAKRLRYTASATGNDRIAERAKDVQSLLGDHQDGVVSRARLAVEARAAHAAGEDTFTYGLLWAGEDAAALDAERKLDAVLKKLRKAA